MHTITTEPKSVPKKIVPSARHYEKPVTENDGPLHDLSPEDLPNIDHLVTEDDTPVDNFPSAKQQRLLVESLYNSWTLADGSQFLTDANIGFFYAINSTSSSRCVSHFNSISRLRKVQPPPSPLLIKAGGLPSLLKEGLGEVVLHPIGKHYNRERTC